MISHEKNLFVSFPYINMPFLNRRKLIFPFVYDGFAKKNVSAITPHGRVPLP